MEDVCYFPPNLMETTEYRKIDYALMVEDVLSANDDRVDAFLACYLEDANSLVSVCAEGFAQQAMAFYKNVVARVNASPVKGMQDGTGFSELMAERQAQRAELAKFVADYAVIAGDGCWEAETAHCATVREAHGFSSSDETKALARYDTIRWALSETDDKIDELEDN